MARLPSFRVIRLVVYETVIMVEGIEVIARRIKGRLTLSNLMDMHSVLAIRG